MSLLDDYREKFVMCDLRTISDGRGGIIYKYVDGAEFEATIAMNDSLGVQIAEKQSVTGEYQITYDRPVKLEYHNVIKRLRDERTFRVIEKDEKRPPSTSSFPNMRYVKVKDYEIPTEVED